MTGRDWRQPLPTRPCRHCGVAESSCAAGAMFGHGCCDHCDHDPEDPS